MRLVLLRHATAVPRGTPGIDDPLRPLTEKGEREARAAGAALRRLELRPPALVTSPYVRARDTARIAAEELGAEVVEDAALASGFDLDELPGVLARHRQDPLVLVGHDPDFSELVGELTGAHVELAKGGLADIDIDGDLASGRCELRAVLRPKHLRLIGGSS